MIDITEQCDDGNTQGGDCCSALGALDTTATIFAMKPIRVHITGCAPRSGTTLMMELFRDCFEIEAFGDHEISVFVKPRPEPNLYCSKRPQDILFIPPLLRFDPELWIVFMMRDPRDVIVSEHRLRPGSYWCHLGLWRRRYQIARKLWSHPRFTVVRYEDLASRPDAVQDLLEDRMPFLRRTQRFSQWGGEAQVSEASERALGGVRPVSADSIGSWQRKKGRIVNQIQTYGSIDQELIDLGYETDGTWRIALEGIRPDEARSVYIEAPWSDAGPSAKARALVRSLRFHTWRVIQTARYLLGMSRRVDIGGA